MEARRREVKKLPHHEQESLCTTRPAYRQGRQLTAVKVYTINDESQHLIVSGVPSLGLQDELRRLCSRYGDIKALVYVPNYATEKFVEGYHVQYARIQSARFAKRQIDGRTFFGGSLHVCYAPEMESVSETRNKLLQRRRDVAKRCQHDDSSSSTAREHNAYVEVAMQGSSDVNYVHPKTCIWNGKETCQDPRMLMPAGELEKISSTNYGPRPMDPAWKEAGVSKIEVYPAHPKKDQHKKQTIKQPKPTLSYSLNVTPVLKPKIEDVQACSKKPENPILRLVPSQVKGAQRKIVFHRVQRTDVPSDNPSVDDTLQSVRDRIRSVSVPNVQIVLDRGHNKLWTSKEGHHK